MHSLIFTLISIALLSAYLLITVDYINPAAQIKRDLSDRITSSLYNSEVGFDKYVAIHNAEPSSIADLAPLHMFIPPKLTRNGVWTLGAGVDAGRYICYTGDFNQLQRSAALDAQSIHSPQAYFINTACGATINSMPAEGSDMAITYWLSSYAVL